MLVSSEKTTSLPMLLLSRRHGKEADYVNSWERVRWQYVFTSAGFIFGHECLSHGPLFSSLRSVNKGFWRGSRWSLSHLHFTALLMIYASEEALKDRFTAGRSR